METVTLAEPQDVTGRLGRLGIGLKTEVEAWESETKFNTWVSDHFGIAVGIKVI